MIHTLSQLSSLGYCALAVPVFFALSYGAMRMYDLAAPRSQLESICKAYSYVFGKLLVAALLALPIVALLNALRLLGAL